MTKFRLFLKSVMRQLKMEMAFIKEAFYFWQLTVKYNASNYTDKDIQKMQYTLLRENHTIEKGMSLRNPKKGFGQEKVKNLLARLNKYVDLYAKEDLDFLNYPLSTIKGYIDYTKENGVEIPLIEKEFIKLQERIGKTKVDTRTGVISITREEITNMCKQNFESLLYSRHSIRYFSNEPVSKESIEKALTLAQRTPSACNRQGWLTHVFTGKQSVKLIKWQGGSRGFEDEIQCSILVTANLKAFLFYEVHQAYVDGGLYAMNLINALHSLGLGTIPLSCGFDVPKLKGLANFDIPENEVPILIIGIGHLQPQFKVAVSDRKDISITNTYHQDE